MPTAACPSREELSAFQVGKLSADALEAIAAHLDGCARCSSSLDGLGDTHDQLVRRLRQPGPVQPFTEAEVQHALTVVPGVVQKLASGSELPTASALPPAELGQLGQYQLLAKLGEGGMGEVYQARHRLMDRVVALKVIHGQRLDSPDAVERFRREIRALARLSHPNIVGAQYADQVGDKHFLVMEYVAGSNLAALVKERGPLPVAAACGHVIQAALGLQHAHEHHLVHRDVKPSNLILTPAGQVKVLDLGLALLREEHAAHAPGEDVTAKGQVLGTVDYMAPEQWEDTHQVDIRADIYSLGCTLYHLLTGAPPFAGPQYGSTIRKMMAHAEAPVPSVRQARSDVPAGLAAVLERMLAKNSADRYATPADVVAALRPFAGETPPAEASTASRDGGGASGAGTAPPAARDPHTSRQTVPERSAAGQRRLNAARRRLALALPLFGLLVLAITLWQLEPRQERLRIKSGPGGAILPEGTTVQGAPLRLKVKDPLQVLDFRVRLYRGELDPNQRKVVMRAHGDLGRALQETCFDDDLKVSVILTVPAHCYLLAYNPDGEEQLCYPADRSVAPPAKRQFTYPNLDDHYFGLNDGLGMQAFVLVASAEPLPPYDTWKQRAGNAPWKAFAANGVWQFDGEAFTALPRERGQERPRPTFPTDAVAFLAQTPAAPFSGIPWGVFYNGPPRPVIDLGQFFRNRDFDAVQLLAFPVRAKQK
jgi:tRNA A-37 threonylcarbamoyl transferase component Bud32